MSPNYKPDSSRLNLFYILHVLQKYSDIEHPMSVPDIREKINLEFGYMSYTDSIISTDTIKRILEEFTERVFPCQSDYVGYESIYGCFWKKYEGYKSKS